MTTKFTKACALVVVAFLYNNAFPADTVKIAVINGLSGSGALAGEEQLKAFYAAANYVNSDRALLGGKKFEIVPFDDKGSPQEALVVLKRAIDQDIRYVASTRSNIAHALIDAVAKHNDRNLDKTVLFLDYNALDPALTEAKCNFWHFRFESHSDIQLDVLTDYMKKLPSVHKVYLLNQDYAYGQAVSRGAREMLARKRPDIQIVGDAFVPLLKVKDFAPYVAKIHASGADAVLTGNWGGDLSLLIKASNQTYLKANFFTLLATQWGAPAAIGSAGADKVKSITSWHLNAADSDWEKRLVRYSTQYTSKSDMAYIPPFRVLEMLASAMNKAGTHDPLKVAQALEGAKYNGPTGESWMRAEDHQLIAPVYVVNFVKAGSAAVKYDAEGSGYGWHTEALIPAREIVPPIKCQMERPSN